MTYSSFWFGKESDTPLPPAPIDIGNSLRFRGASSLTRTFGTTTSTWTSSYWVKRGVLGVDDALFSSNGFNQVQRFQAADTLLVGLLNAGVATWEDASAWYNIVVANNGDDTKVWVNGTQIATGSSYAADAGLDMQIGQMSTVNADHYLSDFYFIDGQALTITDFGKYDDNNKWIPIEYEGNYGNNGFHLTFQPDSITENSDGTITVADMSGLGNNFTGTGFDTNAVLRTGYYTYPISTFDRATNTLLNGGTPYVTDITYTGDGDLFATTGTLDDGMFNGEITTAANGTYIHRGIDPFITSFNIDLRDFTDSITSVSVYCFFTGSAVANSGMSAQLLDAGKNVIPGTSAVLPRTNSVVTEIQLPVSGTPAFIQIFSNGADSGAVYANGIPS